MAYSPDRGLLAVATRSGTIHLIELVPRARSKDAQPGQIAGDSPGSLPPLRRDSTTTGPVNYDWPAYRGRAMLRMRPGSDKHRFASKSTPVESSRRD